MKTNPNDPLVPEYNNGVLIKPGLTKREYFSGLAMQGLLSILGEDYPYLDKVEHTAVRYADGLIEALNEGCTDD